MSTQYNDIGATYNGIKDLLVSQLCDYNADIAIAPYIKGAKVLDLACGTGHYSKRMLEMGAERVVGVDISSVMIDAARASYSSDRITFDVGDCSKPRHFEGGPFDLVTGMWLLNYAPSRLELAGMFQNIAMNLTDGGRFIGITFAPTDEPTRHTEKALRVRPVQYGNVAFLATGEVEDGATVHAVAVTDLGNFEFDCYYLRQSIFETAARLGGMKGTLEWKPTALPEGCDESGRSYVEIPHFSVLELSKV